MIESFSVDFAVERRLDDFVGRTVGKIAFGRDEDPVDIVGAAHQRDEESLRLWTADNYNARGAGFAGGCKCVCKCFKRQVVCIAVSYTHLTLPTIGFV